MTPIQELEHVIGEMGQRIDQLRARAEQAEARAAELASLLREAWISIQSWCDAVEEAATGATQGDEDLMERINAALASRPAT